MCDKQAMSEKMNDNLLVRSESDDDVGLKSPSLSSLKSFRDTFKRSDSATSQSSATSNSQPIIPQKKKSGKLNEDLVLYRTIYHIIYD